MGPSELMTFCIVGLSMVGALSGRVPLNARRGRGLK
jgi:hypothetical protein